MGSATDLRRRPERRAKAVYSFQTLPCFCNEVDRPQNHAPEGVRPKTGALPTKPLACALGTRRAVLASKSSRFGLERAWRELCRTSLVLPSAQTQVEVAPTLAWNGPDTAGRNGGEFMDNIFPSFRLANDAVDGFTMFQRKLQWWWRQLPTAARAPIWPRILAALLILGMLLAFHQVVSGVVQQGELRHKATAMQAAAAWHCRTLGGPGASQSCLLQLNLATHGDAVVQAQNTQPAR